MPKNRPYNNENAKDEEKISPIRKIMAQLFPSTSPRARKQVGKEATGAIGEAIDRRNRKGEERSSS